MAADPELLRQIQNLTERLESLERRLAHVEGVEDPQDVEELDAPSEPSVDEVIPALPEVEDLPTLEEELVEGDQGLAAIANEQTGAQVGLPPAEAQEEKLVEVAKTLASSRQAPPTHLKPSQSTKGHRAAPTFTARAAAEIETLIGGRWYAVVGALFIVIGMGLGFKWAFDSGFFDIMPNWLKCATGGAFGVALLVLGEIARRRINDLAAVGLNAAGVGVCYVSTFAAYGFYQVIGPGAAFVLLAIVAAIGVFIGARARLVSVAVVSILGGYLTPLLLNSPDAHPLVLPSWLMLLMIVGLVLSGWRGGKFTVLRSLVWWGTILYGIGGATAQAADQPIVWICFFGLAWLAVHVELIYSATQQGITGADSGGSGLTTFLQARPLIASLSTTAWSVGIGAVIAQQWGVLPTWCIAGAGQVSTMCLAMMLAGHLSVLRDRPKTDIERLGTVLAMEAGALLITTVALAFTDWLEVSAWLAMGVAAVAAGRWIGSRGLDVYGLVVLAIGTARLIVFDSWATGLNAPGAYTNGFYFTRWSLLIAMAGVAWLAVSWLLTRDASRRWLAISRWCMGIGITVTFMSLFHPEMAEPALTVVWISHGLMCVLVGRRLACLGLAGFGLGSLGLATLSLALQQWWLTETTGEPYMALGIAWNWWMLIMLYGVGAWMVAAFMMRVPLAFAQRQRHQIDAREPESAFRLDMPVAATICAACLLYGGFLHEQTSAGAISVVWLALSVLLSLSRRVADQFAPDAIAMAGFGAATLAWIVAFVVPGWSGSSAGLGLHPGLWLAIVLVAGWAFQGWWINRRENLEAHQRRVLVFFCAAAAVGVLLAATSYEVVRIAEAVATENTARRAPVSIWWGVFALALITAGFVRRIALSRHVGLALLGISVVKVLLIDLAGVPQGWRVASFLGLGLMMLGVSVAYIRLSGLIEDPVEVAADEEPPVA